MDADFWRERWRDNQIGFHLDEVNPNLVRFWPELALPKGSRVLVPLCGKSMDMCWLVEQGYEVVGVELSDLAVQAFFDEQGLKPEIQRGCLDVWQAGAIRIFCGDFFDLLAADIGKIDAVYDRAALIAMPPSMRKNYVQQLKSLVPGSMKCLLVTLFYEQAQMAGPPFAVSPDEVQNLLADRYAIEIRQNLDVLDQNERFKSQGLKSLEEHVFILQSRN